MKSTFTYTTIPGFTQYYGASQDGRLRTTGELTEAQARSAAEKDPKVAYFCQTDTSTYEFYAATDFWLGTNPAHTTTVVSELADTSDPDTRAEVLQAIRSRLWLDDAHQSLDTRGHTRQAPMTVTVGIVFCDFEDAVGSSADLAGLKAKLVGPQVSFGVPGAGGSTTTVQDTALNAFVRRESHGRVVLDVQAVGSWVRVGSKAAFKSGDAFDFKGLLAAADRAATIPSAWDVLVFAFPETSGVSFTSQYFGARYVEVPADPAIGTGKLSRLVFMAPETYGASATDGNGAPANVTHRTTEHELMHALGLPDQYSGELNRSFGWSIMSDCRTGWHLTGIEKLALGWNDIEDYWVLRRGLLPIDALVAQAQDAGKKGIVVMPDAKGNRPEVYALERPQAIGRGEQAKAAVEAEQATDPGLLVLMVRRDGAQGRMVPFVAKRPTDPKERDARGGASRAAFQDGVDFSTNGVSSRCTPGYPASDGTKIRRVVGVDSSWEPSQHARTLRESEMIWKNTVSSFELSASGVLTMDGGPAIPLTDQSRTVEAALQSRAPIRDQDYGFRLTVSDDDVLELWLGGADGGTPLRSFAKPVLDKRYAPGTPALTIESHGSKVRDRTVAVYRRNGTQETKLYDVFRRATCVPGDELAWARVPDAKKPVGAVPARPLRAVFEADGNLAVRKVDGASFVTGTYQQHGSQYFGAVDVDEAGTLRLLDAFGASVKAIAATATGVAPFALVLRAGSVASGGAVVVQDSRAQIVNTLLSW